MTETSASDASQTQRLVAQCCLASFISFFTFTAARSSGSNSFHDDSNTNSQFTPAVDLSAALLAAVVSNKLAWVVPWVTQYLRFLTHDSFTHDSNSVQQLLRQLQDLRTLPMLLPEHPDFGPTQLCLRCALDDQLEQVQEIELQDKAEIDAAWQEAVAALAQQPAEKQRLSGDSRYMQLCCPALEGARQALQVSHPARPSDA